MPIVGSNGKSEEQLREEQMAQEEHMTLQQDASARTGDPDPGYVDQMLSTELSDLPKSTRNRLRSLLSRDWVLSQMTEAEVHEARWLARNMMLELEALHPRQDSLWTGELRRYAADNSLQDLEPLDPQQKHEIFQFIQTYIARVLRSREGMQQEMFRKTISKSERDDRGADEDGGWI
jgi:hypothetical protein